MKKLIISLCAIMALSGCKMFEPEIRTKVLVVPSNEYMVKMTYTNSFNQVIDGYFVPNSKMEDFAKMKEELDFFHSPKFKMLEGSGKTN